uniref:Uncharacterized protein n=1 Tax=Romanomermis culicivorax TaxID=13658 RepID=A0A915IRW5_ROMCU
MLPCVSNAGELMSKVPLGLRSTSKNRYLKIPEKGFMISFIEYLLEEEIAHQKNFNLSSLEVENSSENNNYTNYTTVNLRSWSLSPEISVDVRSKGVMVIFSFIKNIVERVSSSATNFVVIAELVRSSTYRKLDVEFLGGNNGRTSESRFKSAKFNLASSFKRNNGGAEFSSLIIDGIEKADEQDTTTEEARIFPHGLDLSLIGSTNLLRFISR